MNRDLKTAKRIYIDGNLVRTMGFDDNSIMSYKYAYSKNMGGDNSSHPDHIFDYKKYFTGDGASIDGDLRMMDRGTTSANSIVLVDGFRYYIEMPGWFVGGAFALGLIDSTTSVGNGLCVVVQYTNSTTITVTLETINSSGVKSTYKQYTLSGLPSYTEGYGPYICIMATYINAGISVGCYYTDDVTKSSITSKFSVVVPKSKMNISKELYFKFYSDCSSVSAGGMYVYIKSGWYYSSAGIDVPGGIRANLQYPKDI